MKIEPGGGCALYVTLTTRTPSQREVTSRAAVIGVAVVDVGVVSVIVVVVVVELHDDSLYWPETDPMTTLARLVMLEIVAVTTQL
jgi:hypothetical protein